MSTQTASLPTASSSTVFEPVPRWGRIPHGITFRGDATSVAVDSQDRVYVFNRGTDPVVVFDREGNFLESWGHGEFVRPHGIFIDHEDNIYLIDDGGHFVQKRTPDREVAFTLGTKGKPAPSRAAKSSTGRPT